MNVLNCLLTPLDSTHNIMHVTARSTSPLLRMAKYYAFLNVANISVYQMVLPAAWPDFYPELDFECEWTIDVDSAYLANDTRMVLQFVFNKSAYGFGPQSNCDRDYVNFYNGIDADAELSVKVCSDAAPLPFTVSSTQVKIVFRGSSIQHMEGQVGAKVAFYTIEQGNVCSRQAQQIIQFHFVVPLRPVHVFRVSSREGGCSPSTAKYR